MLLVHRSARAANAVRTVSHGGELFVASVVIFMILASFGDAVDPALFGEAGLEFALFDFGGEFSVLGVGVGISCSSCWPASSPRASAAGSAPTFFSPCGRHAGPSTRFHLAQRQTLAPTVRCGCGGRRSAFIVR
jgi:hypothetical protein